MTANIKWLDHPEVFRVNQMPAHSDHYFYKSAEERCGRKSSYVQSLNGKWCFQYSECAKVRPADFFEMDFDASDFDEIDVPRHIELAGYDKIHYINTMYPWEGHFYRRPAFTKPSGTFCADNGMFSDADYNPVGSYLCKFDLNEEMKEKRISVFFEGVEEAMFVWLNGHFVGYAEDSFTPSEFDLTPWIKEAGNILAVEVHKRSTAAFLEDQDFFRFFGIFRDVSLIARPEIHVEDMWIQPEYDSDTQQGKVVIDLTVSCENGEFSVSPATMQINIFDKDRILYTETKSFCLNENTKNKYGQTGLDIQLRFDMPEQVHAWSNHDPYLYQFEAEVRDSAGNLLEVVPYSFGFRKIELKEVSGKKLMLLNGKRLIINGVNRHEWSAEGGRCITSDDEKWDMDCIKRNHINAVRTCHYPDHISWYYRCDENGIYMMAETNLESHGSWQKMGAVEPSWNVPGDIKEWEAAVVDRARTNFEVFKNHTSILFWSLGNESYAGKGCCKMNAFFKENDPGRLVHYESVVHRKELKSCISDMESQMYTPAPEIEKYLQNNPAKPFILCEYMHDMGNSLGGMNSYINLLDKYEMYQGGFIWDFIDQALYVTDEVTGNKVLRYGGDFDDRPSDYEFSGDGIVFANRIEKPAMQEVKYYYGKHK